MKWWIYRGSLPISPSSRRQSISSHLGNPC